MEYPVHKVSGEAIDHIEIRDDIFATGFNEPIVHQAMVRQLANARQGTAATKTRGEISGSTRKALRQKHTGWARRGDRRSPLLRGGGKAFGLHPRSYRQRMPKKMRRLALRCVLSAKASSGEMIVVDQFGLAEPRTAELARILSWLGIARSTLIVTADPEVNVIKSARNLQRTRTLPAALLNVVDLLSYRALVITTDGLRRVEETLSKG